MLEVVYASAETQLFPPKELIDLLAKARQNNQLLGVSGILCYHRGSFLQVLEGEEAVVTTLYDKIAKDPRHHRCIVIKRSVVQERTFADWSMGFVDVSPAIAQSLDGFNSFLKDGVLETAGAAEKVRKVLNGFRSGEWRQHVRS